MSDDELLARIRATDRSFARRTGTRVELTEPKLAAAGIEDFDELRRFLEANGGEVCREPSTRSSGRTPLGVPRAVVDGYTGYWVPRALLDG